MQHASHFAKAQAKIDPVPSLEKRARTKLIVSKKVPNEATCVGVPVASDGEVPSELGLDRQALSQVGFEGKLGQTLAVPQKGGPTLIAVGIGPRADLHVAALRDASAAFARAAVKHERIATTLLDAAQGLKPTEAAAAIVEGSLLARYRFMSLRRASTTEAALDELTIVASAAPTQEVEQGVERGDVFARAALLARDLGNAPATLLTARRMTEVAKQLAKECRLEVEVFDEDALTKMGCGGMLGVNAGSAEPPRLIRLTYKPKQRETRGHLALVGKGIMYDSGGISLKPNDLIHATMKTDMSGSAAVFASMTALAALDCKTLVTGYLMCTDNMPSGAAMKLGDVLTVRGGTTVEVINTDAEGRLVLADGIVLATEQNDPKVDAIVDIATLTGACQRALGEGSAGVIGNDQGLIEQVKSAAFRTDEQVWQLPLDRRYRKELDSEIADLKNVGGENAGAITAALFLEEFVAGIPWAHIDIAGTARVDADDSWRSRGATGYGTRLLIDLAMQFSAPAKKH
jgi:leucyl aminopeptidase